MGAQPGRKSVVQAACPLESLAQGGGGCGIMNGHGTNLINGIDQSINRAINRAAYSPCADESLTRPEEGKRSKLFSQHRIRQSFYDNKPSSKERP